MANGSDMANGRIWQMGWGDTLFYLISLIRLIFRGGRLRRLGGLAHARHHLLLDREARTAEYVKSPCLSEAKHN